MTDTLSFHHQTRLPASALVRGTLPLPVPWIPFRAPPPSLTPACHSRSAGLDRGVNHPASTPSPPCAPHHHTSSSSSVLASFTHCPQHSRKRQAVGLLRLLSSGSMAGGYRRARCGFRGFRRTRGHAPLTALCLWQLRGYQIFL